MSFTPEPYFPPDFSSDALKNAPDARLAPAPADGVAPEGFHATSIYPEYFKAGGRWLLAEESRMDCVPVYENGRVETRELRRLKKGDRVFCGRTENGEEGILLHADGFRAPKAPKETFAFRQGHSRETSFSRDYDELCELLRYEREHGNILWVMGPAFSFDRKAREAFCRVIAGGYVHGVLAGSIRDDGPMPEVYADVYAAQDAMRALVRGATTVICMATMLHTIAVGNLTPSYRVLPDGTVRKLYFYCVDISEFTVNKLTDRGSLATRGIVTNVQDFIVHVANGLGV